MNNYDANITIKLPAALAEIAAKIGRALDPDTGGADSFRPDVLSYSGVGNPVYADTISTTTPCTSDFAAQATYMLTHPEALYAACASDYTARCPDLVPPTLAECEQFCTSVIPDPEPPVLPKI